MEEGRVGRREMERERGREKGRDKNDHVTVALCVLCVDEEGGEWRR